MTERRPRLIRSILLPALLLLFIAVAPATMHAVADNTEKPSDLSKVNWDEEESPAVGVGGEDENLSDINWDEEGDTETEEAEIDGDNITEGSWEDEDTPEGADTGDDLQALNQEDLEALESRERMIHIAGFILFIGYIIGGVLTAFFSRNTKIALDYPPELLIILHSVWPLELLLLPFLRKAVR